MPRRSASRPGATTAAAASPCRCRGPCRAGPRARAPSGRSRASRAARPGPASPRPARSHSPRGPARRAGRAGGGASPALDLLLERAHRAGGLGPDLARDRVHVCHAGRVGRGRLRTGVDLRARGRARAPAVVVRAHGHGRIAVLRDRRQTERALAARAVHAAVEPGHARAGAQPARPERAGGIGGAGRRDLVADLVDPAVPSLRAIAPDRAHVEARRVAGLARAGAVVLELQRADLATDQRGERSRCPDCAAPPAHPRGRGGAARGPLHGAAVAEHDELLDRRRVRDRRERRGGHCRRGDHADSSRPDHLPFGGRTFTAIWFERTDFGSVAFSRFVPLFWRNRSRATPPLLVVLPPTFAPATGLLVWPSTTLTVKRLPERTRRGPLNRRTCCLLNRSYAQRTSSPGETLN